MRPTAAKQPGMKQQEFEALFSKYHQLVYRAAYRVSGSREDAEDALQTLFLGLIDQGFSDELIQNPEGYLYRSAVNQARQMYRARKRRNHTDDDVEFLEDPATDCNAGDADMRHRLLDAIAKLEPEHAEMLLLHYDHGYSDAEIAAMLGKTRVAIAVALHR